MNVKLIMGAFASSGILAGLLRCGGDSSSTSSNGAVSVEDSLHNMCEGRSSRYAVQPGCGVAASIVGAEPTSEADYFIPDSLQGDAAALEAMVHQRQCHISCLWRVNSMRGPLECRVEIFSDKDTVAVDQDCADVLESDGNEHLRCRTQWSDFETIRARPVGDSVGVTECQVAEQYLEGVRVQRKD